MAIKVLKGHMHIHRLSSKGTITKADEKDYELVLDCDLGWRRVKNVQVSSPK